MREFILKCLYFFSPIILFMLCIIGIDTYNYFGTNIVSDVYKSKTINRSASSIVKGKLLQNLSKLENLDTDPEIVILGDSRSTHISENYVDQLKGSQSLNLSFPGADYRSIIDLFWYTVMHPKNISFREVYLCLSFHNFNDKISSDIMAEFSEKSLNASYFLFDYFIVKESFYTLYIALQNAKKAFFKNRVESSFNKLEVNNYPYKNIDNKEIKWQDRIEIQKRSYFQNLKKYPNSYMTEIDSIAQFCLKNEIKLHFIVFPNHISMQALIDEYGLRNYYNKFKSDLGANGILIDFDVVNEMTTEIDIYRDLYHVDEFTYQQITSRVFANNFVEDTIFGKLYKPDISKSQRQLKSENEISSNLIKNGDFIDGISGWMCWPKNEYCSLVLTDSGVNVENINNQNDFIVFLNWAGLGKVEKNDNFRISFYCESLDSTQVIFQARNANSPYQKIADPIKFISNRDNPQHSYKFIANQNVDNARIEFRVESGNPLNFQNIILSKIDSLSN